VLAPGILGYVLWSLVNGHFRRELLPERNELAPGHVWQEIKHHATLNFPKGAAAARYNVLQKLSYVSVIVVSIPLMVLTGLTMSPSMVASWPWLLDVFGGRQSARSIHFIVAAFLVLFVIVHLVMVARWRDHSTRSTR
jgi:thiosulfate reductase cytochrome b subunit